MNDELDILIARYLDGSATAEEVEQLQVRIESRDGTAAELYQAAFYERLLHDALGTAQETGEAQEPMRITARTTKAPSAITQARSPGMRHSPFVRWGAIAACVLLAVGITWRMVRSPSTPSAGPTNPALAASHVKFAGSGVTVARAGGSNAGVTGVLSPDDEVRTAGGAEASVVYDAEATRLTLAGNSGLRLGQASDGKTWQLVRGKVTCEVEHQAAGQTLVIATPQASVTVVGTRFDVSLSDGVTRVQVRQGTVRVTRVQDKATVQVSAGEYVDIGQLTSAPQAFGKAQGQDMGAFWSPQIRDIGVTK